MKTLGIIFKVTENKVYIKEEAGYLVISKELFSFKPKVGSNVKVLKKSDGSISRIVLLKKIRKRRSKSFRFLRATRLYTLVFGVLISFLINERVHLEKDYYNTIFYISSFLIFYSILTVFILTRNSQLIYFLFTSIFYVLLLLVGIALLFKQNESTGIKVILTTIVPLIFNTLCIIFDTKKESPPPRRFADIL